MNKKHLVRKSNKIFGGVCSGLASYFNINNNLVRLVALTTLYFFSVQVAFAYLLGWLLLLLEPNEEFKRKVFYQKLKESSNLKYYKSSDSMFLGVCKGIAHRCKINVVGVRFLFLFSCLTLGAGAVLYIILSICLPSKSDYEIKLLLRIEALRGKIIESH